MGLPSHLHLLFPAVGVLLGWPLAARRIGPNPWYGLRVPATFAAIALAGRDLMALGVVLTLLALLLPGAGLLEAADGGMCPA